MNHDNRPRSFLSAWSANAQILKDTYNQGQEHDACGVGMVAALDGKPAPRQWCRPASTR